jgi:hypothetical protein
MLKILTRSEKVKRIRKILIFISDTSVITNLAAIEELYLLPQLDNQVIIFGDFKFLLLQF